MKFLKSSMRRILRVRRQETISDGINRHIINIRNIFLNKSITYNELKNILRESGINEGDTIILHSSWRSLKSFDGTPNEIINIFLELIGLQGNLLMPCYGNNKTFFSVLKTKSSAGVVSEVFRKEFNPIRSLFADSAMCCKGPDCINIVSNHINSTYTFDEKSPYYKSIYDYNAKIVLLGMGRSPNKISSFHIGSYNLRKESNIYKKLIEAILIDESGKIHIKKYFDRIDGCRNNKYIFKHLFKKVPRYFNNKGMIGLHVFSGKVAVNVCENYINNGGEIYKYHKLK